MGKLERTLTHVWPSLKSPQPFGNCLRTLAIPVTGVTEFISTVRVTVDQRVRRDWNEVDAVRLSGFRRP